MKAAELGIHGTALQAAQEFEARYPKVPFTRGRSTVAGQARAMSQNVVVNRKWTAETYKKPLCAAAAACQKWVDANPLATTEAQVEAGLAAVLATFSDAELFKLSCHLSGEAFDAQPDADKEKDDFLRALAVKYGGKFLDMEGGLKRRHWQARP